MGWESLYIFISEERGQSVTQNSGIKGEETTPSTQTEGSDLGRCCQQHKIEHKEDLGFPTGLLSNFFGTSALV